MKRSLVLLSLLSLLLLAAWPALAQEDPCMAVGGVTNDEGRCVQHAAIDIRVDYPLEAAQISEPLAAAINAYIDQSFSDIVGWFAEGFQPVPVPGWSMVIEHELVAGIVTDSVVFSRYSYTGGANGIAEYATLTADRATGELLTLADLFVPGADPYTTLQPLAVAALTTSLGDAAFPDMIGPGTDPTPENYARWALTADSLNLYFDEYQVAPGAAGPQSIAISLSDLASVLQPQFLP